MNARQLLAEIRRQQVILKKMADAKDDPLHDTEIYHKSCEIDNLIVKYIRLQKKGYMADIV